MLICAPLPKDNVDNQCFKIRYERDKDPFNSKTYYRRKTKEDIGLYEPKQKEEHLEELKRRLVDLRDDYRDIKDLKVTFT